MGLLAGRLNKTSLLLAEPGHGAYQGTIWCLCSSLSVASLWMAISDNFCPLSCTCRLSWWLCVDEFIFCDLGVPVHAFSGSQDAESSSLEILQSSLGVVLDRWPCLSRVTPWGPFQPQAFFDYWYYSCQLWISRCSPQPFHVSRWTQLYPNGVESLPGGCLSADNTAAVKITGRFWWC